MKLNIRNIVLDKVTSTNTVIKDYTVKDGELLTLSAAYQTGGYGQKGNHWEAENGKNLLFSMIFQAGFIPAGEQFVVSQAVSLSIRDALCMYLTDEDKLTIKWPNDIYFENKKICGFLVGFDIENGRLGRCTIGTGLNVNQENFTSDAPNPVSLKQIIHRETDIQEIKSDVLHCFGKYYAMLVKHEFTAIETAYEKHLYHRRGMHRYEDAQGTFKAEITRIDSQGFLYLRDDKNNERRYAFKEVSQLPD